MIFTGVFTIEFILKLIALRFKVTSLAFGIVVEFVQINKAFIMK